MAITFSAQLNTVNAALKSGKGDVIELFALLVTAQHGAIEIKAKEYAKKMTKNVAGAEAVNKAKELENKAVAMHTDKKVGATDKFSSKTLSAEDKKNLNDLADTYELNGINGDYISKIRTGDFTKSDLDAMKTATTGKSDSLTSQQTMDNLEVGKLSNQLSMAINLITKMLDTWKANMERAIGR